MKSHLLPDCFLVWYGQWLEYDDILEEEICDQGYADWKYNGINKEDAKRAKKR